MRIGLLAAVLPTSCVSVLDGDDGGDAHARRLTRAVIRG